MDTLKEETLLTPKQMEKVVEEFENRLQTLRAENESLNHDLAEIRGRLLRNQERERAKLARSLHGGPIQELSSLLFEINTLEQLLDNDGSRALVASIRDNLKTSIQSLRKFINALHPPALAHFGLQPAIRSYVEQLQAEQPNLRVALFLNSEERPTNNEVEWAIYRALQQVVQNVVDHAQARHLMIRLQIKDHEIRIEAEDDGIGFQLPLDEEALLANGQIGLYSARMCIENVGGFLEIHSQPGQGSTIRATAPTG